VFILGISNHGAVRTDGSQLATVWNSELAMLTAPALPAEGPVTRFGLY
jgi:hypothetical protein